MGEGKVLAWVSLEVWPEVTSLVVVAAVHTLRLTAMLKLSASSIVFLCTTCLSKELLEALYLDLWTPWRRLKKDFSNTCPNLKHTPTGLSHRAK
jgi:hypothetical protein